MRIQLIFLLLILSICGYAQEMSKEDSIRIAEFKRKEYLIRGKSVYDFKLIDTDGHEVDLKSFEGKNLYIDFWFTGCRPCMDEFPKSKILEARAEDENITFITISYDPSMATWKKTLEELELSGNHFWIGDKEKQKSFSKDYNISFFPKYWWVNTKGEIIHPSLARPSYFLENYDKFLTLLKEE